MKIYKLKRDVNSLILMRTIEGGSIYTESQLKNTFNIDDSYSTFKDWFEDVSQEYAIEGCSIIKRSNAEVIKSTVYFFTPHK